MQAVTKKVVIAGADRNIGLEMARAFLVKGWQVFAGQYLGQYTDLATLQGEYGERLQITPLDTTSLESLKNAASQIGEKVDHVDMLVYNAAVFGNRKDSLRGEVDFPSFLLTYDVNCLGAMRFVQTMLPLLAGETKRLCFVSSEAGSVSVSSRKKLSGYCMSKTALNMSIRLMFNELQPQGYSFRIFHPGWVRSVKPDKGGVAGVYEPSEAAVAAAAFFDSPQESEEQMMMIDIEGAAWPF